MAHYLHIPSIRLLPQYLRKETKLNFYFKCTSVQWKAARSAEQHWGNCAQYPPPPFSLLLGHWEEAIMNYCWWPIIITHFLLLCPKNGGRVGVPSAFCSRCSEQKWMSSYSTVLMRFVFLNPENKNKINPLLLCCLHPVGSECRGKITAPLSSVSVKGSGWRFSLLIGTTESWSASLSKCFLLENPSTVSLDRVVKVRWLGREGPPF